MDKLKNQNGYALLTVLLTIALISIFSMMLIPKTLSTTLQVNKSESHAQAKELAEMGVHYSIPYLQSKLQESIEKGKLNTTSEELNVKFCKALRDTFQGNNTGNFVVPSKIVNDSNKFDLQYEMVYYNKDKQPISSNCIGFDHVEIKMLSSGKVTRDSVTQKDIRYTFYIKNRLTQTDCPISDPDCVEVEGPDGNDTPVNPIDLDLVPISSNGKAQGVDAYVVPKDAKPFYSSVKFDTIVHYNGKSNLSIAGNAWFNGSPPVHFNGGSGEIFIVGDVYFSTSVSFSTGTQKNYICIGGNAFLYDGENTTHYEGLKSENNCPQFMFEKFQYFLETWELYGELGSDLIISY